MIACQVVASRSAEASHQLIGVAWTGLVNRVPVRIQFEQSTLLGHEGSRNLTICDWLVAPFHIRNVLSFDPDTIRVPSGENATDVTKSV